ncbi:pilus assembly protein CpaE [Gracilibacillus ureilyticus]|uniref:Pilus assembly protein CpaE n=1 Tax=Gracilibacillus ureilyticus TaxID=531814 RepID=A0A1H9VJ51_9BACI|nr:AAA family ATPase [Gracilibacillus ureilyticus]SES21632.1 pilus assembly protein CpaE [Gracilibacillus ureilyticus]
MEQVKMLLVCDNNQLKNQLLEELQPVYGQIETITSTELRKEIDRISPQIIIMTDGEKDESTIELIEYTQDEIGDDGYAPIFIYLSYQANFQLLRDLIRLGVHDFFVLPEELTNFLERLEKKVLTVKEQQNSEFQQLPSSQAMKKGKGEIISFYSGKGGVGRTLLSTLFAQTMKLESTASVLFIDLNLQYGGAEKYLGVESARSIADLLPVIDELNENHVHNVVMKETYSKMDLLLSPRDAEIAETITEEHIVRLLRTCRRAYDMVVIDLPINMDPITFSALEESEVIHYVLSLDTPAISNYKQVTNLLKRLQMDTEGRMKVIVNRMDRSSELTTSDVKEFIVDPIVAKFKEDRKGVQPLINKGEPLRKETKEKKIPALSKQVRKYVLTQLK